MGQMHNEQPSAAIRSVILCGGESRRMGRDKALLPLQGRPMAALLAGRLEVLGPVALSVQDADDYPDLPWPKLADEAKGCGPLGGLCAALRWAEDDPVFVCACDLPLVQAETALSLAAALTPEADAVVPCGLDDRLQPLCAIYRGRCLNAARRQLAAGRLRVTELLAQLRVVAFPADCLPGGARSLTNINTPEEVTALWARLSSAT